MANDLTASQRFLGYVVIGMLGLQAASLAFPEPDPTITFTCPNFHEVHVMDAHWDSAKRTKRVTKILPATCGDTTAITPGYLGN